MITRRLTSICRQTSGFTLIEVVLVIVIIGILASVALKSGGELYETAKIEETKQELDALTLAIAGNPGLQNNGVRSDFGYVGDVGAMPPDLDALYANPGGYSTWRGPYIDNRFTQVAADYKTDAFGSNYVYAGGATITSTGASIDIVRRVANSTDDLLYNSISGNILDYDGSPPGSTYADSITVQMTVPNGSGATATRISSADRGGYFDFDSVPIGNHALQIVYQPTSDTLFRLVSVSPNSASHSEYRLASDVWSAGVGGGSGSSSEVLYPDGSGSAAGLFDQGCATNWQCVDEVATDEDGTYVVGFWNSWLTDLYSTEDHSSGTGVIDSVVIKIRCRQGSSSSRVRTEIRTNGAQFSSSQLNPPGSYTDYTTAYVTNPQSSLAWTWTEIDALEIGVRIRRTARCTQVSVEVFYTN